MWSEISSFLFGATVAWIVKLFFDLHFKKKATKAINSIASLFIPARKLDLDAVEYFKVGRCATNLVVIDGDGEASYIPESLRALFHDGTPDSPDDISDRILLAEQEMERAREAGNSQVWDGIGVGISKYNIFRTPSEDHLGIEIDFYKTRYAAFRATVVEIGREDRSDQKSIFKNYLQNRNPRDVVNFLARHVGVVAMVITADGQMLLTERSNSTGVRRGEYDVSIVEGIEPTKDADTSGSRTTIDIYQTVKRGCREELGFSPGNDEISILGFAVDMDFYQFNFVAVIKSNLTCAQIQERRGGRAKDAWESKFRPIPYRVDEALKVINDKKMWGFSQLLIYWSLLQSFARFNVDARAAQIVVRQNEYKI